MSEKVHSAEGVDGRLELFQDRLELHRKGVATYLTRGFHRSASYSIEDVAGIEIVEPVKLVSRGTATVRLADVYQLSPARHRAAADRESILVANEAQVREFKQVDRAIQELRSEMGLRNAQPIAEASGFDGKLLLFNDRIVIAQKDKLISKMVKGATGAQEIHLSAVTGVQLKRPGMTRGYLQVQAQGHSNQQGGIFGAVKDELSVAISNKKEFEAFVKIKRELDHVLQEQRNSAVNSSSNQSALSIADELEKFSQLRDRGVISDGEYEAQKRKLLER